MALTITSITPSSGVTPGGTRVVIEGTDFDIPSTPVGGYVGIQDPTVIVGIGDLQATNVWVYNKPGGLPGETIIECTTPRYTGNPKDLPFSVDVHVRNIVNPGVVTLSGSFEYCHKDAKPNTTQTALLLISRSLILELGRQIPVLDVVDRTHTTYDDDVADGLNTVKVSDLPSILVSGPSIERSDGAYRLFRQEVDFGGGDVRLQSRGTSVDLFYTITIVDELKGRLLNLSQYLINFVDENGRLPVEKVLNDPSSGFEYFDIDWSDVPDLTSSASKDDLISATGVLVVKGVHLDRCGGFDIESTYPIDEIVTEDNLL